MLRRTLLHFLRKMILQSELFIAQFPTVATVTPLPSFWAGCGTAAVGASNFVLLRHLTIIHHGRKGQKYLISF